MPQDGGRGVAELVGDGCKGRLLEPLELAVPWLSLPENVLMKTTDHWNLAEMARP